jgi:hypothetical protein
LIACRSVFEFKQKFETQTELSKIKDQKSKINKFMNERDIFDEKQEIKKQNYACTYCGQRDDYDVRWMKRTKKKQFPRHLSEQDRARFQKSQDYMVRIDDVLMCKNMRCRKRFDIPSSQTVVFI